MGFDVEYKGRKGHNKYLFGQTNASGDLSLGNSKLSSYFWNDSQGVNAVSEDIEKYFRNITIGKKILVDQCYDFIFQASFIMLLTNQECRELYLSNTERTKNDTIINFRTVLMDDELRRKALVKVVRNIGLSCEKYNVRNFQKDAYSYIPSNYKNGGERHSFYLSLDGVLANKEGTYDLTPIWMKIKSESSKKPQTR